MNRCSICDKTELDGAFISFHWKNTANEEGLPEPLCAECHSSVETNLEDLSIADEDFLFSDRWV